MPIDRDYLNELASQSEVKVMMVCLGNICRSPMAAAVLHNRAQAISKPRVLVDSSGTGPWHVGEGANPKSIITWESAGYKYEHVAKQFQSNMFLNQDLLLVMDETNFEDVLKLAPSKNLLKKVILLREFESRDPNSSLDSLAVPDPYYKELPAYAQVLQMVEKSITGLLSQLSTSQSNS